MHAHIFKFEISTSFFLNIFFLGIKSRLRDDDTSFQHGVFSKSVPNLHFVSSNLQLHHEQTDRYKKRFRPLRLFQPFKKKRVKLAYYPLPWKSEAMESRTNTAFADLESDEEVENKHIKLDDEALKNPEVSEEVSDKHVNLDDKALKNPQIPEEVSEKLINLDDEACKHLEVYEEVIDKQVILDDDALKNPKIPQEVSDKHIKLDENCSRKFESASTCELGLYFPGQSSGEKNADSEISRSYLPSSKHIEHTRTRSNIMKSLKEDNDCSNDDTTEDNFANEVAQLLGDEEDVFSKNQESLEISGTYSAQCLNIVDSDPDETDNETTLPEPLIEDAQGNLNKDAQENFNKDAYKNLCKDAQENLYKHAQKNLNKDPQNPHKNLNSLMDPKTVSPGLSGFKAQHKPHDLGFVCVNNTHDSSLHWNTKVHKRGPINPNSGYFLNANIRPEHRDILNPPVRPELRKLSSAERYFKLKESQSSLNPGIKDSLNKENPRDLIKLQKKALVYPRPRDCISPTTLTASKANCNTQMSSEFPENFNKNSVYCSEFRSSSSPNLTPGTQFNTDSTRYYPIQPNHGKHSCSTQGVSDDKGGQETPDIHRYPFNTDLIRPYTTEAMHGKSLNKIRRIEYEHDYGTRGRMHQLHPVNLSDLNQKKNIKSQGSVHKYSQFKNEEQVQRYTRVTFTYLLTLLTFAEHNKKSIPPPPLNPRWRVGINKHTNKLICWRLGINKHTNKLICWRLGINKHTNKLICRPLEINKHTN